MSVVSLAAELGLVCLVTGIVLVNVLATPRAAQVGTILAGVGVLLLAATAVGHLLT
jgi:hypothetical protein